MIKKKIIVLPLLLFICLSVRANFEVSPAIRTAYTDIIDLRFEDARRTIEAIKSDDPSNMLVHLMDDYIDFYTIFINEDKDEFKLLKRNKKERLKKIKKYGDKNSPYYLFVQAEIELHWAVARAKFGELLRASGEAYSAYKLLRKNQQRHPDFVANLKSLSAIHALAESIPGVFRFVFGIDGTVQQGTAEIKKVVDYSSDHPFLFKEEAIAIYTYILFYQNNEAEKAWAVLRESNLDYKRSPLVNFLMASMAAKMGKNEDVLNILNDRPTFEGTAKFHYLDFLHGKALLDRLDPNAEIYLNRFIKNFKGRHFIKEAHQKLAWYELVIRHDKEGYKRQMINCKKNGHDLVDEDKQALKEAESGVIPNIELLKVRLLFDGGYYQRAKDLLISIQQPNETSELLEYQYRMGRVLEGLGEIDQAIEYYKMTLSYGKKQDSYMACSAALHAGLIYEHLGQFNKARTYFETCLEIKPDQYKNSLHQKAKSGRSRLR